MSTAKKPAPPPDAARAQRYAWLAVCDDEVLLTLWLLL